MSTHFGTKHVRLSVGLVSIGVLSAACYRSMSDGGEHAAQTSSAVHGTTQVDTTYTSIAKIFPSGCSAVKVGPYTYMTASHCVAPYAQDCYTPGEYIKSAAATSVDNIVTLTLTGDTGSTDAGQVSSTLVTGTVVHPRTYVTKYGSACASNAVNSCFNIGFAWGADGGPDGGAREGMKIGLNGGSDIALIWTSTRNEANFATGQAPPAMPVVTGINLAAYPTPYSIHANLTSAFDSSTRIEIAGFGWNDLGADTSRFSGSMKLGPGLDGGPTIELEGTSNTVNCSNQVSASLKTSYLGVVRTGPNDGVPDHGDSGSPAIVTGGTGPGQVPGLASNVKYVVGVLNGGQGSNCQNNGPIDGGLGCKAWYSPTFSGFNGSWLDQHLVDFDGDGFKDWEDHCPTVASADNRDSNMDAEYSIALAQSLWPYGSDVHAPTEYDWENDHAYADTWHDRFPGDACDYNPVSPSTIAYKFENGESTPCDTMTIYQSGGVRSSLGTSGNNCKRLLSSGMRTEGLIGSHWGHAPDATGEAQPAFCPCTKSSARACDNGTDQCYVAADSTFPYISSPTSSSWSKATRRTAGADAMYQPFLINHQDPSTRNATFDSGSAVSNSWNFRNDLSGTNASVVFWSHVTDFSPVSPFDHSLFYENNTVADLNNSYARIDVTSKNGEHSVTIPVNINLFVPIWLQVTRSPSAMVPWMLTTTDAASGQARLVLKDAEFTDVIHPADMTSTASTVLAPVADGSTLLAADDVLPGATPESGFLALVLNAGTARPTGAIKAGSAGGIDGEVAQVSGTNSSVLAVAFASRLDRLFSIRDDSGDFYLDTETVSAAFQSGGSIVKTATKLDGLYAPKAMAWNQQEGVLFVMDAKPYSTDYALRLVRLALDGSMTELWELKADSLPSPIYLRTGSGGEVVATLGVGSAVEIVIMDGFGKALYSQRRADSSAVGPAVFNRAGLSVGYQNRLTGGGLDAFTVDLVLRKDLTTGGCAATWLIGLTGGDDSYVLADGC